MLITYRRVGGPLTLLAGVVAAAMLSVAVAAAVITVALFVAPAVWLACAVLRWSSRRAAAPLAAPWPHRTIDATAVVTTSAEGRDPGPGRLRWHSRGGG